MNVPIGIPVSVLNGTHQLEFSNNGNSIFPYFTQIVYIIKIYFYIKCILRIIVRTEVLFYFWESFFLLINGTQSYDKFPKVFIYFSRVDSFTF